MGSDMLLIWSSTLWRSDTNGFVCISLTITSRSELKELKVTYTVDLEIPRAGVFMLNKNKIVSWQINQQVDINDMIISILEGWLLGTCHSRYSVVIQP